MVMRRRDPQHYDKWTFWADSDWFFGTMFGVAYWTLFTGVLIFALARSVVGAPLGASAVVVSIASISAWFLVMMYRDISQPEYPAFHSGEPASIRDCVVISSLPGLIAGVVVTNTPLSGWANPTAAGLVAGLLVGTLVFLLLLFLQVRSFKGS